METLIIHSNCKALETLFRYILGENTDNPLSNIEEMDVLINARVLLDHYIRTHEILGDNEHDHDVLREIVDTVYIELVTLIDTYGINSNLMAVIPYDIVGSVILVFARKE